MSKVFLVPFAIFMIDNGLYLTCRSYYDMNHVYEDFLWYNQDSFIGGTIFVIVGLVIILYYLSSRSKLELAYKLMAACALLGFLIGLNPQLTHRLYWYYYLCG